MLPGPAHQPIRILDIGCGCGPQTMQLAKHIHGKILAVDNHLPFLEELQRRADAEGVSEKIETSLMDMHELSAAEGTYDIIWSEGALFILGFRNALELCSSLLVPDGVMAVTELSWIRPDPPDECRRFFADEYPDIADIDTCRRVISGAGFHLIDHFVLPETAWLLPFYEPLEKRLQKLRDRYAKDAGKLDMIASVQKEISMYRRYSDYYGYVFYIMQKRNR